MLLIIVGAFFICWGPKLLLNAMKKHQLDVLQTEAAFDISVRGTFDFQWRRVLFAGNVKIASNRRLSRNIYLALRSWLMSGLQLVIK